MRTLRGRVPLPADIERRTPAWLAPRDPFAGDEVVDDPGNFVDYRDRARVEGERLDRAAHDAWDVRFRAAYRAVLDGDEPWGSTDEAARMLAVHHPIRHDIRPLRSSEAPVDERVLSDHTEDYVPAVGVICPDRILGPWSDEPVPRRVRRTSAIAMAMTPLQPPAIRPLMRIVRSKPKPRLAIRGAMLAAFMAPPMLWSQEPDGHVQALLPYGPRMDPDGPVLGLPQTPRFLARIARSEQGWWAAAVLPLPVAPPPALLLRRMALEWRRMLRHDRRMTWEDGLRERGEVLYRTACEWLWMHARDQVLPSWADWSLHCP